MKLSLIVAGLAITVAGVAAANDGDHQCSARANAASTPVLGSYVTAIARGELGWAPQTVAPEMTARPTSARPLGTGCLRAGTLATLLADD